jgi:DNA polymerase
MNQAGLYVDRELIAKALDFVTRAKAEIKAGFSKLVNDACKPTQRTLYADWLWLEGVDVANTKKHTLKAVLETDLDDNVRESIVLFGEANKTSVAKLSSMLTRSDEQGCMRELVQYHGAHTGRWAGRGVQIQNMIRPKYDIKPVVAALQEFDYYTFKMIYDDVIDRISNCSRAFIVAPPDGEHELYIADFEQIESRVTAWLAGQQDMLDTFAAGEDIYCKEATGIFGYTITKKENEKRQVGKVGTLSLGYEGGIGAFVKMGANYNLDLRPIAKQTWMSASPDERESAEWHYMIYLKNHEKSKSEEAPVGLAEGLTADIIKQRWRASHPKIVQFWRDVEAAAIEAVQTKKLVKCGKVAFFIHDRYLVCKLPSGRNLCYPYPALKLGRKGKMKLSYRVMHQGRWIRNDTYGGALTENIVQAVSRDLLRDAMLRCEDRYPVAATIHDEMIAIVRKGTGDVQEFIDLMKELPEWAAGLPVGVAGWASERYGKD